MDSWSIKQLQIIWIILIHWLMIMLSTVQIPELWDDIIPFNQSESYTNPSAQGQKQLNSAKRVDDVSWHSMWFRLQGSLVFPLSVWMPLQTNYSSRFESGPISNHWSVMIYLKPKLPGILCGEFELDRSQILSRKNIICSMDYEIIPRIFLGNIEETLIRPRGYEVYIALPKFLWALHTKDDCWQGKTKLIKLVYETTLDLA